MRIRADDSIVLMRRGLLALAGITTLGIAAELAVERHWSQPVQLVAWGAVLALAIATMLIAVAHGRVWVRTGQLLAVVVILSAGLGIAEHVYANYDSGELDRRYSSTWGSLSEWRRWELAMTKTVGPSPPFAPGALAEGALAVLIATIGHPALARGDLPR
jgi:hypothetical protein